jgi:hypothetical protein
LGKQLLAGKRPLYLHSLSSKRPHITTRSRF